MTGGYGPIQVPAGAWRRADIRAALRQRDVCSLLRFVQQHAGVSQARLATAAGLGQGRVNEIINGRRQVTRLDVLERLADGLAMPDDARVLFGLAPAHTATLTGHAEIAGIFATQSAADQQLRDHAATASRIDILAVRALGLVALNDSLLRGPLTTRATPVQMRVLLLDPGSPAVVIRAAEIGESAQALASGIRLALAQVAELNSHPLISVETAVYSTLPTWRMLIFDGILYLSAFGAYAEGHRSGMYKLAAATDGVLHAGFLRQFADMWCQANRVAVAAAGPRA
jgi:transcriptional regulator with XRE-family HTH domain